MLLSFSKLEKSLRFCGSACAYKKLRKIKEVSMNINKTRVIGKVKTVRSSRRVAEAQRKKKIIKTITKIHLFSFKVRP